MRSLLASTLLALACSASAQAADLGVPRSPVAAAVMAPSFSWTGFYVGIDAGFWHGRNGYRFTNVAPTTFGNDSEAKIGGHVGYRHQFANNFVIGAEADLSWLMGRRRDYPGAGAPFFLSSRFRYDSSVRAIGGYAFDRALAYVTAGVTFANYSGCGSVVAGGACFPNTAYGGTRTGLTVGAGLAYAVTPNISVRTEYLYGAYGVRVQPAIGFAGTDIRHRLDTHTVRLGVSYTFNTAPSAVVARY